MAGDRRPTAAAEIEERAGRDVRPPGALHVHGPVSRRGNEHPLARLRYATVGGVDLVDAHLVAQHLERLPPNGEERPGSELADVLDNDEPRPVHLDALDHRPGRGPLGVVMRPILPAGPGMALARGAGQQDIVHRYTGEVALAQVLARVLGAGVVRAVVLHGQRPVVGRPGHVHASEARTLGPAAEAREEVDGGQHHNPHA